MCSFLPDWSDMKIHIICYVTANFQMWEKSGPWGMDQNASWHHAPWTMGKNLIKPPEFFMVMSIFLKWMAGSNGRGRWQGGVIDSSLTFSFFQSFLLTTKAKKMRKSFSLKEVFQLNMPAFILTYLPFLFCCWYGEFFFILHTRNMENFNCADRKYFSWPNLKKIKHNSWRHIHLKLRRRMFI